MNRRVSRSRAETAGWWAGIAGLILVIAGFFSVDDGERATPADGPIPALVEDLVASPGRIVAGSLVGTIGALLLVWFGSSLRVRLGDQGDAGSIAGLAAYGFTVVMTAGGLIHGSYRLSLTTVGDPELLAEAVRPLAMLEGMGFLVFAWATVGLALAISLASFAVRLLPKPMAAIGLLLAVVAVGFSPTDRGGFALLLMLWLVVAGVMLSRHTETASA